jgi:type IV secretion system protein TrbJ
MPLQLKKHRKWLIAAVALVATATPSFALFGLGDIVFDRASS